MSDPKQFDHARRVLDAAMTMRLEAKRWEKENADFPDSKFLAKEMLLRAQKLHEKVEANHPDQDQEIIERAADVANYVMMILYSQGTM